MKKIILFAISVFIFAFAKPQDSVENLILLENYYQKSIADWNVPGMAVAIVSADSILFARGFGVCDVEKPAKVDENTLFAVASNTKAFTSTALAILVDEGKLRWDDKVQQHLSWFRLYDPYVSYNITIKDLLSHRSGLKTFSGDLIWYGSNYSREEVIRKAAFLKPSYGFRERFGYSNIMYLTAGEIIPQLTNQSWDNFVEQRLLRPIGMMRSVLHVSDLKEISNVAQPHTYVNGELIKLPWLAWDNIGPAGSLISSAKDMGLWLQFNLNLGKAGNQQIVSSQRIRELQQAQTVNDISQTSSQLFPSTHFKAYGMGWSLMDYLGKKIVSHNGGYDGMISQTVLIPEMNLGFVILTNSLSSIYYPLMYKTLDVLLGNTDQRDWSAAIHELIELGDKAAKEEREKIESQMNPQLPASLPLEAFTGLYSCSIYDSVEVRMVNDQLYLSMMSTPDFQGPLTHYRSNTFKVVFPAAPSLPPGFATFSINRSGDVENLEIFIDNPDFDFTELKLVKLNQK